MFVQVIATICMLAAQAGGPDLCFETRVVNTDINPRVTWGTCVSQGQQLLSEWKEGEGSKYAGERYRIGKYKCIPDRSYVLKGTA